MTFVIRFLIVWFVYALLGVGGLSLAVPPTYASPIYPAEGAAIAFVLVYGKRMLPAIWIGYMTSQLVRSWHTGTLDQDWMITAMLLGTGAILQTWAAHACFASDGIGQNLRLR